MSQVITPNIVRRARDFYAVYCASSDGKNYQGLPCPQWDALPAPVRGHWHVVALRSLELEGMLVGVEGWTGSDGESPPGDDTLGHLARPGHARSVWESYMQEKP